MAAPATRAAGPLQGLALVLPCTTAVMGSAILAPNIPQMIAAFRDIPDVEFRVPALVTHRGAARGLLRSRRGAAVHPVHQHP